MTTKILFESAPYGAEGIIDVASCYMLKVYDLENSTIERWRFTSLKEFMSVLKLTKELKGFEIRGIYHEFHAICPEEKKAYRKKGYKISQMKIWDYYSHREDENDPIYKLG